MMLKRIILYSLPFMALFNLFTGYIPTLYFAIIILIVQFTCVGKTESSLLLLLFAGVFGVCFKINGFTGIGSVLWLMAMLYMLKNNHAVLVSKIKFIVPLLIIFGYLLLSVNFSTGGDYAPIKLQNTIISGITTFIAFAIFFHRINELNLVNIAIFAIIYGFFTLSVGAEYLGMPHITDLYDVGYFRVQMSIAETKDIQFNYQNIGFYGCFALAMLTFFKNTYWKDTSLYQKIILAILSSLVILYSGSRQSMLTWVFVISIVMTKGKVFTPRLIFPIIGIMIVWQWITTLDIDFIQAVNSSENLLEASYRDELYMAGLTQFESSPFMGVGYGRFLWNNAYGDYPHNILIEILCEIGLIGSLFLLIVVGFFYFRSIKPLHLSHSQLTGVISILLIYGVRSLISADLSSNIDCFSIYFAIPFIYNYSEQ